MKFKNVLVCTMAILPMFCAIESQAGDWGSEIQKIALEKKHNSEGYKNTRKLNEKQRLFLGKAMVGTWHARNNVLSCMVEYDSTEHCKDGAEGFGWKLPFEIKSEYKDYISSVKVHSDKQFAYIEVMAEPKVFGDNVTLIYDCGFDENHNSACLISPKSTCLEKKLCQEGVFDVTYFNEKDKDSDKIFEYDFRLHE